MGKNINQLKVGSVLSYIQMFMNIVIGVIYSPIMIKCLGQSEYGLYQTVTSTISLLSLLNLGFGNSYIKYYSKYKIKGDDIGQYRLNGMFITIFIIIGLIAFVCGMYLSQNLELVFDSGLTSNEYNTAKTLMILLTVNLSVSFPMGVFANIISANEKFIFLKTLGMLRTVVSPLVTLPLLLIGFRSIGMVVVGLVISLITDIIYIYYNMYVLKTKFRFDGMNKKLFGELAVFSSFIAINLIIDQINWNIDKLLIARYRGTISVAIYSVGFSLYSYYQMFSISLSGVFAPRIHNIVNTSSDEKVKKKRITDVFIRMGRIQFLLLGLIATGLIFFGKQFIHWWVGAGYEESYYVMLLLVLPSSVPLIQNVGIEVQRAINKHQFRSIVYAVMAILNLGMSIILCKIWGAVGAAIGTAASLIIANGIIMNIYYHKKCSIDILLFWKNILRMCLGLIIPVIFGLTINMMNIGDGLWSLIVKIVLYSIVYGISVWNISMNDYEKDLIRKPLGKVIDRLK